MKLTKIVSYIQGAVLPFAFVMAPAVIHAGCAGSDQEKPPPQVPQQEEKDESMDPYEGMCEVVKARGERCPSREEWCRDVDCK